MKIRTCAVCLASAAVIGAAEPPRALAQALPAPLPSQTLPRETVSPLAPFLPSLLEDLAADFARLPSKETASLLGFGAALAMAGHPADRAVTLQVSRQHTVGRVLEPGNIIGGYQMQLGGALATYTIGRLTGSRTVSAVGSDLVRAHIVAQTVTGAVKITAKRTRPDGTNLSFPSGHTSASFASAAVLQRHFGWKVGAPAMAVAAYVAAARVHEERHFLSDVAFGAAIGLAAGRTVTFGRGRGTFALAPAAAPGGAGVAVTWVGDR